MTRKGLKLVAGVVALVLVGILGYLAVTAYQVWSMSRRDEARSVQAIVVLGSAQYNGAPSPDLASRLDHALELWRAHLAPGIVLTGGRQNGDRYTEAEAGATYLEHRGVPKSALREIDGRNTWRSLSDAASLLEARGEQEVVLVSDPFHSARITAISSQLQLRAFPSPSRSSPIRGIAAVPYYAKETVGLALGRVIGFDNLSGS